MLLGDRYVILFCGYLLPAPGGAMFLEESNGDLGQALTDGWVDGKQMELWTRY